MTGALLGFVIVCAALLAPTHILPHVVLGSWLALILSNCYKKWRKNELPPNPNPLCCTSVLDIEKSRSRATYLDIASISEEGVDDRPILVNRFVPKSIYSEEVPGFWSVWSEYYNGSDVPIVEFSSDGTVLNSNDAFREISDGRENLLKLIIPIKPAEIQDLMEELELIAKAHHAATIEVSIDTRKGYTGIMNIMPNFSDSSRFMGFIIDITEFKDIELQLYHSQKLQAIGQLAGGIAHDFNNIMTTVLGVCDLLLSNNGTDMPEDHHDSIKQIQQNSIRAINLVRQLLAFSRKQLLTPSLIDVSETIEELSNNLLRRLIGENIILKLNMSGDKRMIRVDASQFEQIIINLAVNARDAMVNGGSLAISTRCIVISAEDGVFEHLSSSYHVDNDAVRPGRYVLIEVSDTGSGIPEENLHKVCEPFFSTKQFAGSGLGLSTVYGIVKQTGGHIYISSEVGRGTTFYILFKSAGSVASSTKKTREGEHITKPAKYAQSKSMNDKYDDSMDLNGTETLMIVEDEVHVRSLCVNALKNKGYTVIAAGSCEEALELFKERSEEIELIVTDIVMMGMRGSELAVLAKNIKSDLRIIFMSGYAEGTIPGLLEGECVVLPKPFTLKQLAITVRRILDTNF